MALVLPCLGCGMPLAPLSGEPCPSCQAPTIAPHPDQWSRDLKAWVHRATVRRVLENYGGNPNGYPSMVTALFRGQQVTLPNHPGLITLPHALTIHEAYPLAVRLSQVP